MSGFWATRAQKSFQRAQGERNPEISDVTGYRMIREFEAASQRHKEHQKEKYIVEFHIISQIKIAIRLKNLLSCPFSCKSQTISKVLFRNLLAAHNETEHQTTGRRSEKPQTD